MGALAFTASKSVQRAGFFPMMAGVTHVPYPDPYRPILQFEPNGHGRDYGDAVVDYIENVLFASALPPDDVAAFLVEPIQGEGGYVVPPPHFFPRLRELCDKYGILLIVDEVQSGMGRTGKWWAIEHWGVEPDIVCLAKGIASGMPLGAMVARRSVMDWPPGAHGNTYGGNPISCAAALATIHLLESGFIDNATQMGEHIQDALDRDHAAPPVHRRRARQRADDRRGIGEGHKSKEPAKALRNRVVQKAFEKGLLVLGCGRSTVRFAPPLNIERGLVDEGLALFEEALAEAEAEFDGATDAPGE